MNRPRYPKYKASGVDWLGEVPKHWEVKRSDGVIHSESSQIAPEQFSDQDVFHYSIPNVQEYGTGAIEEGESIASAKQVISSKVVLVSKLNPRKATVCIAEPTELLTLCSGELVQLHAKHCHITYLYYLCLNELFRQRLDATVQSVTRSHQRAYPHDIFRFWHAWPTLPEQHAIADFLDRETARLDTLVGKKRALIARLKERRAALITRAVTRGLDPAAKLKDSGVEWLGMVPEGWEVMRLKFIATIQTGITKGKDYQRQETIEVPYLRVANVQDGYLDLNDLATIEVPPSEVPRYLLRPGDVLMNEGGDYDKLGRGHVWSGEVAPCIHQNHVFAVRPHGVPPKWLNTFTGSATAQFYFMERSKQSTNLASLSSRNLMEISVPLPPTGEMMTILEYLDRETGKLDRLTASVEAAIERLQEYRAALITAAVTGKIDVREAPAKEAA